MVYFCHTHYIIHLKQEKFKFTKKSIDRKQQLPFLETKGEVDIKSFFSVYL